MSLHSLKRDFRHQQSHLNRTFYHMPCPPSYVCVNIYLYVYVFVEDFLSNKSSKLKVCFINVKHLVSSVSYLATHLSLFLSV